jgi:peptidoglycan/LPS O-acetylase OafA/YrhL
MDEKYRMTINMSWTTAALLFPILFYFLSSKKVRRRKDVQLIIGLHLSTFLVCFVENNLVSENHINSITNIHDLIVFSVLTAMFVFTNPRLLSKKQFYGITITTLIVCIACLYQYGITIPNNPSAQIEGFVLLVLLVLFILKCEQEIGKASIFKSFVLWSYSPYLFSYLITPFMLEVCFNYSYNAGGLIFYLLQAFINISIIIGLFIIEKHKLALKEN